MTALSTWFDELEDDLRDFAVQVLPCDFDVDGLIQTLRAKALSSRCKSKEALRLWAIRQIAKHPEAKGLLRAARNINLDVQQFIDAQYQKLEPTPFPEHVINGETVLIKMPLPKSKDFAVWFVPLDWFELAQRLWPMHLRALSHGRYYVAKKIGGHILPVHTLFVDCEVGQQVKARDGNLLNYCDGNLYVVSQEGPSAERAQRKFEKQTICQTPLVTDEETGDTVEREFESATEAERLQIGAWHDEVEEVLSGRAPASTDWLRPNKTPAGRLDRHWKKYFAKNTENVGTGLQ